MTELFPIGLPEQIAEVQRELALRERVYPRFIAAGKMTQANAQKYTARMQAVLATLKGALSPPSEDKPT
jgi:hypothetical protein